MTLTALSEPGTGLPLLERFALKAFLKTYALFASKATATERMRRERKAILLLVKTLNPEEGSQRVLIDRIRGIEDNSRFWSVFMVLEHLAIVNAGILAIIETLCANQAYPQEVHIADVKPDEKADILSIKAFDNSVTHYLSKVSTLPNLRMSRQHPHPWFGPLNAHSWHCLASVHHSIHYQQICAILKKLR